MTFADFLRACRAAARMYVEHVWASKVDSIQFTPATLRRRCAVCKTHANWHRVQYQHGYQPVSVAQGHRFISEWTVWAGLRVDPRRSAA